MAQTDDSGAAARGAYLFDAGGCANCHTDRGDGVPLGAGGAAIKTPFGAFYPPNITADRDHGIGGWTEADFRRALRQGIAPDGSRYYPVFPFTTYTRISDADIADLWAYVRTIPASNRANRRHEVGFPLDRRFLLAGWRWLYFDEGRFVPAPGRAEQWNRGAYLVNALAHCGECHTPRTRLGGLDRDRWLAGNPEGPDGDVVPNITPDAETGIAKWSEQDIVTYLRDGRDPSGDSVGGVMADVVLDSTSHLTDEDLAAIAAYVKALPPIRHAVE